MKTLLKKTETGVPTEADARLAKDSNRILGPKVPAGDLRIHLDDGQVLTLPCAATRLLSFILTEMAAGNSVTLIPVHAEMTTQEAADYLNVSRPYLIKLLKAGAIPCRKVGTHRRVQFADVKAYKARIDSERDRILDDLAADAQALGMGY